MFPTANNVFKKKPTIYASGQGSQYANNTQSSKIPTVQVSQKKFLGIVPERISIGSKRPIDSNMPASTPAPKSVSVYSPMQSVPKTQLPTKIAASGAGSQYMNNTSGRIPTTPTFPAPAPAPSATDSYIGRVESFAEKQKKAQEERRIKNAEYIKSQYALNNENLDAAIPEYETAFNVFKNNSEAGVRDIKASGEVQKQNTRDYYGEAQKLDAMNRNQNRSQTGRTFAALGTTESRGEGSYQQGMENIDSEFNSVTSRRLSEQANKLTEIDSVVGKAERDSIAAIQTEEAKKNTLIRQIQIAKRQNNLDEVQALTEAYNNSEDIIASIQENLDGLKYQSELEKEKLTREMESIKADFSGLSPEFISSGSPKNMSDMMFINKYKDTYKEMLSGSNNVASENKNKVLTVVNNLLGGNTAGISGAWKPGKYFSGGTSATAQADWNTLKAMLSLEGRQQLKGTGAISDFEAKILENAATMGLDQNLPEEVFVQRLNDLKTSLEQGGASSSNSTTIRVRDNATGQTGVIPASEFDSSIYTRI